MAKEGGRLPQDLHKIMFEEAKTIVKERKRRRWLQQNTYHNR